MVLLKSFKTYFGCRTGPPPSPPHSAAPQLGATSSTSHAVPPAPATVDDGEGKLGIPPKPIAAPPDPATALPPSTGASPPPTSTAMACAAPHTSSSTLLTERQIEVMLYRLNDLVMANPDQSAFAVASFSEATIRGSKAVLDMVSKVPMFGLWAPPVKAVFVIWGLYLSSGKAKAAASALAQTLISMGNFIKEHPAQTGSMQAIFARSRLPRPPPVPDYFVSRSTDLDRVEAIFRSSTPDSPQHVFLFGVGGLGKSTLARRFLAGVPSSARTEFLPCVDLNSKDKLLDGLFRLRSTPIQSGEEPYAAPEAELKSMSDTFLVLDNFETPYKKDATGTKEIVERLVHFSKIHLLITTRNPELAKQIPSLRKIDLSSLDENAARELFLTGAGSKHADDHALQPLLQELSGHPLAIRLVSAQAADVTSLEPILEAWREAGSDFVDESEDDKERSLTVTLNYSFKSIKDTTNVVPLFSLLTSRYYGLSRRRVETTPGAFTDLQRSIRAVLSTSLAYCDDKNNLQVLPPIARYVRKQDGVSLGDKWFLPYIWLFSGFFLGRKDISPVLSSVPDLFIDAEWWSVMLYLIDFTGVWIACKDDEAVAAVVPSLAPPFDLCFSHVSFTVVNTYFNLIVDVVKKGEKLPSFNLGAALKGGMDRDLIDDMRDHLAHWRKQRVRLPRRRPPPQPFVGRQPELNLLLKLLDPSKNEHGLLVGPSGLGKTALALKILDRVSFRYHVEYLSCRDLRTEDFPNALFVFGVRRIQGEDPYVTLQRSLKDAKKVYLVVDDFDTIYKKDPDGVRSVIKQAIAKVPALKLLFVSTDSSLVKQIPNLITVELPPLSLDDARALFLSRQDTDKYRNDPQLPSLLELLGGLPSSVIEAANEAASSPSLAPVLERLKSERRGLSVEDQRDDGKKNGVEAEKKATSSTMGQDATGEPHPPD
ncbi:hypothetical protein JCM8547_005070 [Rhodosporidiobolus lusitaniae]